MIICFCLFDNYASKFGTGFLFKSYNELDFEPRVEWYEAHFNILTEVDYFPLVYSRYNFPTGSDGKSKHIYVDSVIGMWVENKNLYVRIIDSLDEKKILIISSISTDGVASNYDILELDAASSNHEKGLYFDKSFLSMVAIGWRVFFPTICIFSLLTFIIYRSR